MVLSVQLGGAGAGRISFAFTRIPVSFGGKNQHLCVTGDGELAVVCVCLSHVLVSTCRQQQQQAGGGHAAETWERTTALRIPAAVPYPDTPRLWQPIEKWFDSSRGSMLVLYRINSAVFIVDLHRKTMEKVMDCFLPLSLADKMNRRAVPYEMDLVDFFMLKLGGLSISSTGSSG